MHNYVRDRMMTILLCHWTCMIFTRLDYCMFLLNTSVHQCSIMHMTHMPSAPPSLVPVSTVVLWSGDEAPHSPPMRSGSLCEVCCLVELGVQCAL